MHDQMHKNSEVSQTKLCGCAKGKSAQEVSLVQFKDKKRVGNFIKQ